MENNENENNSSVYSQVPVKVTPWMSFKSFMFQDIVIGLTPMQSKVLGEVRDFWRQEIYFDKGFHLRPYTYKFDEPETNAEQDVKVSL